MTEIRRKRNNRRRGGVSQRERRGDTQIKPTDLPIGKNGIPIQGERPERQRNLPGQANKEE